MREENGEWNVVLPGQAAEFAAKVAERGERERENLATRRVKGPVEAESVRPAPFPFHGHGMGTR